MEVDSKKMKLRTEILFNLVIIMVFSMLLMSIFILKFSRDFMIERLFSEHADFAREIEKSFIPIIELGADSSIAPAIIGKLKEIGELKQNFSLGAYRISGERIEHIQGDDDLLKEDPGLKNRLAVSFSASGIAPTPKFSRVLGLVKRLDEIETIIPLRVKDNAGYAVLIRGGGSFEDASFKGVKAMVIIYTLIFALIITVFGYVLLSKNIVKPLEKITAEAARVASGDLEFRIEGTPKNEIGELAESLKSMTQRLLNNQRDLRDNLDKVQRLNDALKEAQSEIVRAEKLASIGRLSSGVAHEIGNPLSAVLGYVELLRKDPQGKENEEVLIRSEAELLRMSRIIKQLLDFSKPVVPEFKTVDMNVFIREVLDDLEMTGTFKGMGIEYRPMAALHPQTIDAGLLRQILVNLLNNAAFAVREKFKRKRGGKVTVDFSTSTVNDLTVLKRAFYFNLDRRKEDPPGQPIYKSRRRVRNSDPPDSKTYRKRSREGFVYPRFLFNEDEQLLKISVEDNGGGITRENIQKIFDPFYTTKEPGCGVGLGLYMTLNHVGNMGGYIDVISEEEKGSMFLILLPMKGSFSC